MTAQARRFLKWELRWIPVEMAMIGFGLFLLLGLAVADWGVSMLFAALAISAVVRGTHYLRVSRPAD